MALRFRLLLLRLGRISVGRLRLGDRTLGGVGFGGRSLRSFSLGGRRLGCYLICDRLIRGRASETVSSVVLSSAVSPSAGVAGGPAG
jgi:hypothetical protein